MVKKAELKQSIRREITDILCDICGTSCKYTISKNKKEYIFNFAAVIPNFGYGSSLDEQYEPELHMCDSCFTKTFLKKEDNSQGR